MAVKMITAIKRYTGTAAEIAAFDLTGIPVGSTFFESDTGILKVLNAAGALVQAPGETVQLSGSLMELYGAGVATRPLATAVTVGTIYEDVTAQVFYQSDGTNWVVM